MVFGKLIQSLGLRKAEAPEAVESAIDTTPALTKEQSSISSDGSDIAEAVTESGDETTSESSGAASASAQAYSKLLLLQARTASAPADGAPRYSTRPASDFESLQPAWRSRISPKSSSPKEALSPKAGSWAAMQRKTMSSNSVDDDVLVHRSACSILNKLTIEKFDSLFEQLATCGIKTPQHLEMLMSEVFNKATTQHHFIPMYADLCVRLEQDFRIQAVVEAAGQKHSFRRLLLNQCQVSFEQSLEPCVKDDGMEEDSRLRHKQQAIGNMKLIGHLLVHGIVTAKLLVDVCEEALRCQAANPDILESLAALLMVAGKQFDNQSWQYHPQLLNIFASMRKLSKDKATPPRVRYLLRDLLDVREAGWAHCSYKSTLAAVPMRLDEVRANEEKHASHEDLTASRSPLGGKQRASKESAAETPTTIASGSSAKSSCTESDTSESCAAPFDLVAYRRALNTILGNLASDRNIPAAVRRMRLLEVPAELQAKEFTDILTRIVEEKRGPIRRCSIAFATGLGAAEEQSAFEREACLDGISQFFIEVYPDLCSEIPRLPAIVTTELLPTLRNVFSKAEISKTLPSNFGFNLGYDKMMMAVS